MVNSFFASLRCKQSPSDSNLYEINTERGMVYIVVCVDDMLLFARTKLVLDEIAKRISSRFEVRMEQLVSKNSAYDH